MTNEELTALEKVIHERIDWMGDIKVCVMEASGGNDDEPEVLVVLSSVEDTPSALASGTDELWGHIDGFLEGYSVAHHVDETRTGHFFGSENSEAFIFLRDHTYEVI